MRKSGIYRNYLLYIFLTMTLGACEEASRSTTDIQPPEKNEAKLIANAPAGNILGHLEAGAIAFKGVPYAIPPVGNLRWQPPQPKEVFAETFEAKDFGHPCPQKLDSRSGYNPDIHSSFEGSEDCLSLNLWRPQGSLLESDKLAVMVFLHGGANLNGSSSEPLSFFMNVESNQPIYNGAKLAALGNVLVVTLNYRLGPLGFMAHPAMFDESESGYVGNYGLLDQIQALRWVKNNIEAFGGDKDNVTLFGQSAGAYDTCTLMNSPLVKSEDLIHKAIMQSGICTIHTGEKAFGDAQELISEMGCGSLVTHTAEEIMQCMRSMTPEELTDSAAASPDGIGQFNFYPYVDGYIAPTQPDYGVLQGTNMDIPFMIGSNSEEYSNRYHGLSEQTFQDILVRDYGDSMVEQIHELYPLEDYENPAAALSAITTDRNLTCSSRKIARNYRNGTSSPVYRYHFRRTMLADERLGTGAYHGSELIFLFQNMDSGIFNSAAEDITTQELLLQHWTQFAQFGDPNISSGLYWPSFNQTNEPFMIIDSNPSVGENLAAEKCDFWF